MILLAALAFAACSDDGDDGGQGPDGETPEGDVLVRNNRFEPPEIQVESGATVVWAWDSDGVEHNVTFEDQVTSGNRGSGTFERTFEAEGTFPYLCTIHGSSMSGVVTVSATAPNTGGDGDDDDKPDGGGPGGYPGGY
jgi:plastocyanin